jgi:hypothetical protein
LFAKPPDNDEDFSFFDVVHSPDGRSAITGYEEIAGDIY